MSEEPIKQADNALKEFGEKLAEIVHYTQELFKEMTSEQRTIVEFLAKHPELASAIQEYNQLLEKEKVLRSLEEEE